MLIKIPTLIRTALIASLTTLVACGSSGSAQPIASSSASESSASSSAPVSENALEPHATVAEMGIGINLGNTLDAYPREGDWALPAQRVFLEDFREAGFQHVRIPATWDDHTSDTAPYAVTDERMDRAEEIVDWAMAEGFYVILNAHHERWIWEGEGYTQAKQERFNAIWTQIAERFKDKSPRLMFEILNEPIGLDAAETNQLNAEILPIIREQNPDRLVVIAGHNYSGVATLQDIELPEDDFIIANFHSYDPWPFAGECTRRWGSDADKADLAGIYATARSWAEDNGVALMLNEFGAPNSTSRIRKTSVSSKTGSPTWSSMSTWPLKMAWRPPSGTMAAPSQPTTGKPANGARRKTCW